MLGEIERERGRGEGEDAYQIETGAFEMRIEAQDLSCKDAMTTSDVNDMLCFFETIQSAEGLSEWKQRREGSHSLMKRKRRK